MSVYFLSFSFALMSHAHGCGLEGRASPIYTKLSYFSDF